MLASTSTAPERVAIGLPETPGAGHIIIASNRGPYQFLRDDDGEIVRSRGAGGLVTALSALHDAGAVTWFAAPLTDADRDVAALQEFAGMPAARHGSTPLVRFVPVSEDVQALHYGMFSNPFLWFLQHGLWHMLSDKRDVSTEVREAWERGYAPANDQFAQAIAAELDRHPDALVLLQDYHLYTAAAGIRQRHTSARIQHFTHIPWPSTRQWLNLPNDITRRILTGLLASDVVRFQTRRSAQNFLATCFDLAPDARVDFEMAEIAYQGRVVGVRHNAVSVDVEGLRRRVRSLEVERYRRLLLPRNSEETIVRVDRMDPAKDILGGIRAYGLLLERRPGLRGRVRYLAFLVPSRREVPEYQRYAGAVFSAVDDVNSRFARPGWKPIEVFYEDNYDQALAAMTLYDVLVVNPIADGMNLVAKEGPAVNRRDGVLILSTGAGAFEELSGACLPVAPGDVRGLAQAMWRALTTPQNRRRLYAARLRAAVEVNDVRRWLRAQLIEAA